MPYKRLIVIGNGKSATAKKNGNIIDKFDYIVRMNNCKIGGYEEYVGTRTDLYRAPWDRIIKHNDDNKLIYNEDLLIRTKNFLFIEPDYDTHVEVVNENVNIMRFLKMCNKSKFATHRFHDLLSSGVPVRLLHDLLVNTLYKQYGVVNIYHMTSKQRAYVYKTLNNIISSEHFSKRMFTPSSGLLTLMYIIDKFSELYEIWVTGFDAFATSHYWNNWVADESFFAVHSKVHERLVLKSLILQKKINIL